MKEKLPVIYNTVENMFLFAITDIDTQRNLSEFFGKTKISRIQKSGTPKGKPDVQEVEIELIDDNIIKMLEIGNHVTYMPKDKGTLYVGYTRYPDVPKTEEGYIRQGRDTENGFIRFKQNLLNPKANTQTKQTRPVPPEVLYYVVSDKEIKKTLTKGIQAKQDSYIALFTSTKSIIDLLEKDSDNFHNMSLILEIDTKKMIKDGYAIIQDKIGKWFTKEIESQYISVLK